MALDLVPLWTHGDSRYPFDTIPSRSQATAPLTERHIPFIFKRLRPRFDPPCGAQTSECQLLPTWLLSFTRPFRATARPPSRECRTLIFFQDDHSAKRKNPIEN